MPGDRKQNFIPGDRKWLLERFLTCFEMMKFILR